MDKSVIKESLERLLSAGRITQVEHDTAVEKLDNPTPVVEQDVINDIVKGVSA